MTDASYYDYIDEQVITLFSEIELDVVKERLLKANKTGIEFDL